LNIDDYRSAILTILSMVEYVVDRNLSINLNQTNITPK